MTPRWPTFMAALSTRAGERIQGAVQGFASNSGAAASIIGLISGSLLYTWMESWVFVVSAGIIATATLLTITTQSAASLSVEEEMKRTKGTPGRTG